MKKLPLFIFSISIFSNIEASNGQSSLGNSAANTPDSVSNFQPSLGVVIGMLAVMFSLTFVLLLYAKFCHRAAAAHGAGSHQIHDGLPRSRSAAGGGGGVDKTVVESLPFFRFSSLRGARDGLDCAVCLAKFEDVEILRLLPKCKHAFHIDCIDQWLDKHSTCPLCRRKVTADDLSHLPLSTSLRFLWNPNPPPTQDSDLELYVEREESGRRGSSRFCIGGSFRKEAAPAEEDEAAPIPESMDLESPPPMHRFNHKIVVAEAVLKNRWSNVSSSDIMFLSSEMMNDEQTSAAAAAAEEEAESGENEMRNIKEEMEKKRAFESKVREINGNIPEAERGGLGFESSSSSSALNPSDKRSMSEIVVHQRFTASFEDINAKEERARRLWIPIARKTVEWFANRERRSSPPQSQDSRLNI